MKRAFRLPGSNTQIDRELDDELRFHLEGRIEELMASEHLSRDEAEREARRRFGDFNIYRTEARDIDTGMLQRRNRMELFDAIRRESIHAARALLRAPSFSLIAILTLALGLGAATTIFTVLDRVVIRPLPYPHADRLAQIMTLWPKTKAGEIYAISKGQYFYFKQRSHVFSDILLYDAGMDVALADGARVAERVPTIQVSASAFSILGITPEKGRLFGADAELAKDGEAGIALISHEFWVRRFGKDPNIVGSKLRLADQTVEIIGVLSPGAALPDSKPDVWIPNHLDPNEAIRNNHTHRAIGLLKPGVTVEAALVDVRRVQQRLMEENPTIYSPTFLARSGFSVSVMSLRDKVLGPTIARALWLTFAAVGFVLLIAGANVANLFLVRLDARRREVAVRSALGASRSHLAAYYLAESLLVSVVAAASAIAIAYGLLHVVLAIAPQSLPRVENIQLDATSIAFCAAASIVVGILFGLLPLTSPALDISILRDSGRGSTASKARELARGTLIVTQVALAVLLLSGAGLMIRSFANLRSVKPGFQADGVTTMSILLPTSSPIPAVQAALWHRLIDRVDAIPGVLAAGGVNDVPLNGAYGCSSVIVDRPAEGGEKSNCMPWFIATPGYFEAMGIPVKGTRSTWADVESGTAPVVVASAFAERFWKGETAIGHGVYPFNDKTSPMFPVVGVAGDVLANGLQSPPIEAVYFPIVPPPSLKNWFSPNMLAVRAPSLSSAAVARDVRRILTDIEPTALVEDVRTMESLAAQSMAQTSFTMLLLLISSLIALVLSAVGIYGVISYIVNQRRSEIGIRIALGAQISEVARLVVRQSLRLAITGAAIGIIAALAGTRLLQSLLFNVSAVDPLVMIGTVVVLITIAALASLGPARRAAKIDPVEAMRG